MIHIRILITPFFRVFLKKCNEMRKCVCMPACACMYACVIVFACLQYYYTNHRHIFYNRYCFITQCLIKLIYCYDILFIAGASFSILIILFRRTAYMCYVRITMSVFGLVHSSLHLL